MRRLKADHSEAGDVSACLVNTGEGPACERGHKLSSHHQGVVADCEAAPHVHLSHQRSAELT